MSAGRPTAFRRGPVSLVEHPDGWTIYDGHGASLRLDAESLRWLVLTSGPAALCSTAPDPSLAPLTAGAPDPLADPSPEQAKPEPTPEPVAEAAPDPEAVAAPEPPPTLLEGDPGSEVPDELRFAFDSLPSVQDQEAARA